MAMYQSYSIYPNQMQFHQYPSSYSSYYNTQYTTTLGDMYYVDGNNQMRSRTGVQSRAGTRPVDENETEPLEIGKKAGKGAWETLLLAFNVVRAVVTEGVGRF
ncbi:hypothetical protein I4U23_014973 [Adineta vaga]|nr:hypothetical protein I4U23_014973 [Adineta vaga]